MVDTKNTDKEEPAAETAPVPAKPKEQYIVLYKSNKKGAWVMLPVLYSSIGSAVNKLKVQIRAVEAKALKLNIEDGKADYEKIKL